MLGVGFAMSFRHSNVQLTYNSWSFPNWSQGHKTGTWNWKILLLTQDQIFSPLNFAIIGKFVHPVCSNNCHKYIFYN